jgi:peptidoglycan/LPS O-acetylase OafA/YrhL/glycosyltransferase involved in cell wall biosynthesis
MNKRAAAFYRPELDSLRFLAFSLVFCHHSFVSAFTARFAALPWIERIPAAIALGGEFGVDLFFVLSAYLISELLLREKQNNGKVDVVGFYLRRILRIWPLYFTFVLLCFILPAFTPSVFPFQAFLCFLLLAGNWYCALYGAIPSPVSPLWSVSIEEQFYLFWPWIVRRCNRTQLVALASLLVGGAYLARWVLFVHSAPRHLIWFNSFTRMDSIGAGVLIAVLLNGRIPRIRASLRVAFFCMGLACLWLSTAVFGVLREAIPPAEGTLGYGSGTLAAVLIFISFLGAPQDGLKFLTWKVLVYLGRISYGLYVVHQLVLEAVKVGLFQIMGQSPTGLRCVLAIAPTVLLAAISYRWLESPFLRLKKRFEHITTSPVAQEDGMAPPQEPAASNLSAFAAPPDNSPADTETQSQKGSTMPLVSIITPVYNAARWLPETLATVRAQTLTDWEHLLVDDGSTDGSAALVEAAAREDARFRLLRTERNGGPSAARNVALDAARGRFIAFLDADDLWLPEKLARSVEWMTTHGYGFIYHDYRQISNDGARVGALIAGPDELNLCTLHTRRGTGSCLSVVIDREKIHGFHFPRSYRYLHEDFCGWLSLIHRGHVGHRLAADLGRNRLSAKSRSANKLNGALHTWRIYREVSKLSWIRAAMWWMQYAWNGFWLYRYARPR